MTEQDNTPEVTTVTTVGDPLRSAFAQAMGVLIEALPPGRMRDLAIEQLIGAHQRTEELLTRYRVLN